MPTFGMVAPCVVRVPGSRVPSGLAGARAAGLAPLRGRLQPHEVRAAVAEAARAEAEPALSLLASTAM